MNVKNSYVFPGFIFETNVDRREGIWKAHRCKQVRPMAFWIGCKIYRGSYGKEFWRYEVCVVLSSL